MDCCIPAQQHLLSFCAAGWPTPESGPAPTSPGPTTAGVSLSFSHPHQRSPGESIARAAVGEGRRHVHPPALQVKPPAVLCLLQVRPRSGRAAEAGIGPVQRRALCSLPSSHQERSQPFPHCPHHSSLFAHCQSPELTEQDGHSRWAPVLPSLSLHALPVPPSWHGPAALLPFPAPCLLPSLPACCGDRAGPSDMCQARQHPQAPLALLASARCQPVSVGPMDTACFFPFLPNNHHLVSQFSPSLSPK